MVLVSGDEAHTQIIVKQHAKQGDRYILGTKRVQKWNT